jgi:hypothetical protein
MRTTIDGSRLRFDLRAAAGFIGRFTTTKHGISTLGPNLGCRDPKSGLHSARMSVSIHEQVIERLQQAKGDWPTLAEQSGVPLRTIEKIARREVENPGVKTVEKLWNHFLMRDAVLAPH